MARRCSHGSIAGASSGDVAVDAFASVPSVIRSRNPMRQIICRYRAEHGSGTSFQLPLFRRLHSRTAVSYRPFFRGAVAGAGVYICGTHDGFESTRAGRLADCSCREQSPTRAASKLTLSIAAIGQESP